MERLKAIYKLVNSNNEVEYIGQAYDPYKRFKDHINNKQHKFLNRTDLKMEIIEWVPKIGVIKREEYWQLFYGFKSERQKTWDTINADPEKKIKMYKKIIKTKTADPEKVKETCKKIWQTRRKNKHTIDTDPEKKIEMYKIIVKKRVETMKLKRLKKLENENKS